MSQWETIENAPRDGRQVYVKRMYEGRVVKEGLAVFDVPVPWAPMLQSLGQDPLNRPIDYAAEAQAIEDARTSKRWLLPDRVYAFPEPTHWAPNATPPADPR